MRPGYPIPQPEAMLGALPMRVLSLKLLTRLFNPSMLTCQLSCWIIHKVGYGKVQAQQCASPVRTYAVPLLAGHEGNCSLVIPWPRQSAVDQYILVLHSMLLLSVAEGACFPGIEGSCAEQGGSPVEGSSRYQGAFVEWDNNIVPVQSEMCIVAVLSTSRQI